MALSQFIEPYSAEQAAKFISEKRESGELKDWMIDAYKFKPMAPHELMMLSGDEEIARYIRATCVRMTSSSLPKRNIDRGELLDLDFNFLLPAIKQSLKDKITEDTGVVVDDAFSTMQKRLIGGEQGILLAEAAGFLKLICDVNAPIEKLASKNLKYAVGYYLDFHRSLPKINSPKDLPKLTEVSFIKDKEGRIIGEYSKEEQNKDKFVIKRNRRRFYKGKIPLKIKQAIVAVEDNRFWNFKAEGSKGYEGHKGVDFGGLIGAVMSSGSQIRGASTITMQLAKNLLLYEDVFKEQYARKRSLVRKLKEYILVKRLENALTKDEILTWYLNTIDFGRNSQGIVMGALSFFDKKLENLTTEEIAMLVGLPKSPYGLDPQKNCEGAVQRRKIVLSAMRRAKYIDSAERKRARATVLKFVATKKINDKSLEEMKAYGCEPSKYKIESLESGYAQFYVSAVEKQMKEWLRSFDQSPDLGFDITVPINHEYQKWAVESLQRGLLGYERARGTLTVKPYEDRLPNISKTVAKLLAEQKDFIKTEEEAYAKILTEMPFPYVDGKQFILGVILGKNRIGLADGTDVNRHSKDRSRSKIVKGKKRTLKKWDVILLEPFISKKGNTYYRIASFTKTQGGIVVLDNLTGEVLATSGGFSIGSGKRYKGPAGNRAFNAFRQPGSTVKPFTYLYAMSRGVPLSEAVFNRDLLMPKKKFNGQRVCDSWDLSSRRAEDPYYTVRRGLEKSKNRITVNTFLRSSGLSDYDDPMNYPEELGRGIDNILGLMQHYGLYSNLDYACFPILLGAEETTVVEIAGAYATIANQGIYNKPTTISSITRRGVSKTPFGKINRIDAAVLRAIKEGDSGSQTELFNLFRLRTMLQGVVKRGTASSISKWSNIIAGKTGTTNGNRDAWFVGFNKDITVAVWVGNVDNKSLGSKFAGGRAALPIFTDFMEQYYAKYPNKLKDTFSNKEGFVADVEPITGFRVTNLLQSDFEYYTGSNRKVSTIKEYYVSRAVFQNQIRDYYTGSRVAAILFYAYLSNGQKASLRAEYKEYRTAYHSAQKENAAYCRKHRGTELEYSAKVLKACSLAGSQRGILKRINSVQVYYAEVIGFTK